MQWDMWRDNMREIGKCFNHGNVLMLIQNLSWLSAAIQEHCLNLVTNFNECFLDNITNEKWIKHLFSVEDDMLPDGLLAEITEQLMKL